MSAASEPTDESFAGQPDGVSRFVSQTDLETQPTVDTNTADGRTHDRRTPQHLSRTPQHLSAGCGCAGSPADAIEDCHLVRGDLDRVEHG